MSRSKLFNMVKSRGTSPNGRNSFDLSNRHAYSMKAGVIKPLKAIHTIPDDFMNVDVSDFSQTFPMHTAAFLRGRKEIAAYFVPYNSIWHNFNQYMATREDPDSALLQPQGISKEPRMALFSTLYVPVLDNFTLWAFYNYFYRYYVMRVYKDAGGVVLENIESVFESLYDTSVAASLALPIGSTATGSAKALSVQYGIFNSGITAYAVNANTESFANTRAGLTSFGRDGNDEIEQNPITYYDFKSGSMDSFTYSQIYKDIIGNWRWQGMVDKLDMLGYGNLYPHIQRAIHYLELDFSQKIFDPSIDVTDAALTTLARYFNSTMLSLYNAVRRVSLVNTHEYSGYGVVVGDETYVNPYPLFAYNRVFYDMFRNSYYDLDYNVRNYNCDFISDRTNGIIEIEDLPVRFFGLEMHQWKKDMFTGVLPEPQFGVVSSVVLDGSDVSSSVITSNDVGRWAANGDTIMPSGLNVETGSVEVDYVPRGILSAEGMTLAHTHSVQVSSSGGSFDVMALRRAECLQQYRMDLLRAGNKTSDIFKQIFGTNPKSELDEAPYFIEVMGNDIFVDPVVSTAATGNETNGSLGDIAARGLISGNNMKFKFSTKDFGCIIFVAYIVPESMYNSYRIDPHLMNLDPEEHFIPQFQNLGFSPVYGEWLSQGTEEERNAVRGYAPPYLEFKTDIDVAHGLFASRYFNEVNLPSDGRVTLSSFDFVGSLSHWVVSRTDMQNSPAQSLANFYINPRILDSVFLAEADDTPESDQFICYTSIGVQAVRQLSELGLPRFC